MLLLGLVVGQVLGAAAVDPGEGSWAQTTHEESSARGVVESLVHRSVDGSCDIGSVDGMRLRVPLAIFMSAHAKSNVFVEMTPLMVACYYLWTDLAIELIMKRGADPRRQDRMYGAHALNWLTAGLASWVQSQGRVVGLPEYEAGRASVQDLVKLLLAEVPADQRAAFIGHLAHSGFLRTSSKKPKCVVSLALTPADWLASVRRQCPQVAELEALLVG